MDNTDAGMPNDWWTYFKELGRRFNVIFFLAPLIFSVAIFMGGCKFGYGWGYNKGLKEAPKILDKSDDKYLFPWKFNKFERE